jgi:Sporulation related domain.
MVLNGSMIVYANLISMQMLIHLKNTKKGEITNINCAFCKFDNIDQELDCYYSWLRRTNSPYYAKLHGCIDATTTFGYIGLTPYATAKNYTKSLLDIYNRYPEIKKYDDIALGKNKSPLYYRVQLGAFVNKDNAINFAKNVHDKHNLSVLVKHIDEFYKVQVGAYSKKENAEAMQEKMRNLGYTNAYITTQNGTDVYCV